MTIDARRDDAYLIELASGVVLLAAANVLLRPDDPGFLSVQPHPALLVVGFVAVRHGLRAGCMAAFVIGTGIVGSSATRVPDLTPATLRSLVSHPTLLLMVTIAFVLGAVGEGARRRAEALRARLDTLEHELADQAVRFLATTETKHALERRLAEESGSLPTLYAAARAMETLEPAELRPAIVATACRLLGATACQLYLLEGDILE